MQIRRVVTGENSAGRSVVSFDDTDRATIFRSTSPHSEITRLWSTDRTPAAFDGPDLTTEPWVRDPPAGALHWQILTRWPDSESGDASDEAAASSPRDATGFHRTDSLDLMYVMSGEIWMTLDEGEVHLVAGDCLVQRGTVHAWRNSGTEPCQMMAFMISTLPTT
jgi:mannose-6-phosphate isomerase-like protein (cupin superfamily)